MSRVLIVGGGVIGMLLAREMAQVGWQVSLFERGVCGREASWAGGGIVSPLYPWRYGAAITALAQWSQDYYPELTAALKQESDIDSELSQHGMLMLSVTDADAALAWSQTNQRWLEMVDADFIYQREPLLAPGFESGMFMPQVSSVRNPRMMKALRQSLLNAGRVELYEQASVDSLICEGSNVIGVKTAQGSFHGDAVVVTAGAWSGGLLDQVGVKLPVEPVKGQMILFRGRPNQLQGIVMKDGRYLIPRKDGRILCGSTLEYSGFDKTLTNEARDELYAAAIAMMPALEDAGADAHWAGLRPGSPDGIPYIGKVPTVEGLFVNAGQFRNGLVLAPGSVRVLADELLERQPALDGTPYQLTGRIKVG